MRSSLLLLASCERITFDSSSDATTPTGDGDAVDDARVDDARVTDAQQIACGPVNCGVAARFMVCNGRGITICDELATQAFARQQCLFWGGDLLG